MATKNVSIMAPDFTPQDGNAIVSNKATKSTFKLQKTAGSDGINAVTPKVLLQGE